MVFPCRCSHSKVPVRFSSPSPGRGAKSFAQGARPESRRPQGASSGRGPCHAWKMDEKMVEIYTLWY